MRPDLRFWLVIISLNAVVAAGADVLAPTNVGTTADRVGYEYVAQHPLAPDCPHNIYCYRLLVPSLLGRIPAPEVQAWRAFTVLANVATGSVLAALTVAVGGRWPAAIIASILYQGSFGATFALFDPFTPDAAVYLFAALLALCWWFDRPLLALGIGVIGVFAKEAVALVLSAAALAAWLPRPRPRRHVWLIAASITWLVVLVFHATMDLFAGWTEQGAGSADLLGGSWLARWLSDVTLTPSARLLYLFIPFGFGWLYAVLGLRHAPDRLKALALGAVLPVLALVYVQTPERALATASFCIVPLAALFLSREPVFLALAAALTNALLAARVGLSTALLPPIPYLLVLAGAIAAAIVLRGVLGSRSSTVGVIASSRTASSK